MEEPNRLNQLCNFLAKDILIPSSKVGALSGKAIFYIYRILHTSLYHQHPAFVLMDILIVSSLLSAMNPFLFRLLYMCRTRINIVEVAFNPVRLSFDDVVR